MPRSRGRSGADPAREEEAITSGLRRPAMTQTGPSVQTPAKLILVPEKFSGGAGEWASFIMKFELISKINGWAEDAKALHLAVTLPDALMSYFAEWPLEVQTGYEALKAKVGDVLAPPEQRELRALEFRHRIQESGESLSEFAQALRTLVRGAYAEGDARLWETLLLEQFLGGLRDPEVRLGTRMAHPQTLAQALGYALQKEAVLQIERRRTGGVTDVRGEPQRLAEREPEGRKERTEDIAHLLAEVNRLRAELQGVTAQRRDSKRQLECWACGQEGHVRTRCPRRRGVAGPVTAPVPSVGLQKSASTSAVVRALLHGMPVRAIIDTGAAVSIVGQHIWKQRPVQTDALPKLTNADGEGITVRGRATGQLQVGTFRTAHQFIIAEVTHDCILGEDFLARHRACISYPGRWIQMDGAEVAFTPEVASDRKAAEDARQMSGASRVFLINRVTGQQRKKGIQRGKVETGKEVIKSQGRNRRDAGTGSLTGFPVTRRNEKGVEMEIGSGRPRGGGRRRHASRYSESSRRPQAPDGEEKVKDGGREHVHDSRRLNLRYKAGDRVWLWRPVPQRGQSAKVQKPWSGPYEVVKTLSDLNYRIRDPQRTRKRLVVHVSRLRPVRAGLLQGGKECKKDGAEGRGNWLPGK